MELTAESDRDGHTRETTTKLLDWE